MYILKNRQPDAIYIKNNPIFIIVYCHRQNCMKQDICGKYKL